MNFDQSIKAIRMQHGFTQEELAEKLFVSRQTISSWENGRNLPDLEMVVRISQEFSISLDTLILGSDVMMNKLIKDGSDNRRKLLNAINIGLFVVGIIFFVMMAMDEPTISANGMLQEKFYLVGLGYLFIFGGIIFLLGRGVVALVARFRKK